MSYSELLEADRRLFILRLLVDVGGSANDSVIQDGLKAGGHRRGVTREVVRAELRFLEGAGCADLEWFNTDVLVASITRRGVDVASGDVQVDGIKRPSIGR